MKKIINLAATVLLILSLSFDIHANPNNIKQINIKNPYVKQEVKNLKNRMMDPSSFYSVFANNNFIFLYGGGLIAFKSSEPNEIYSFINVQKLGLYGTQGDTLADFSIDNSCKYAIINNSLYYKAAKKDESYMGMYFCNLAKCTAEKISVRNSKYLVKSWSGNSKYFAFYDNFSSELMLFDTTHDTLKKICNYNGKVNKITVLDDGNILLNSNNQEIYSVDLKGGIHKLSNGSLICSINKGYVFFKDSKIYEHNSKDSILYTLGKGFNLERMDKNQAILSNAKTIKVFNNHSKKLYTFNNQFEYEMIFSPDSQKYLYNKTDNTGKLKVVFYNGKTTKVDNLSTQPYSSLWAGYYMWIDNNCLVYASLQAEKKTHDYFKIEKLNVLNGVRTTYQTGIQ